MTGRRVDADGKATASAMTDADIKRFTQLVRESIGLKEDRGDQLNVMNQSFKTGSAGPALAGPPIWQAPWLIQLAKQIVGAGLVLLVAFMVLKPLMRSLTGGRAPAKALAGGGGPELGELDGDKVSLSARRARQSSYSRVLSSRSRRPAPWSSRIRSAPHRWVKDWVSADG